MRPLYEIKRDYFNAFFQVRRALKASEQISTDQERESCRVVANVYTKRFRHFLDEAMHSYPSEYQKDSFVDEPPTTTNLMEE